MGEWCEGYKGLTHHFTIHTLTTAGADPGPQSRSCKSNHISHVGDRDPGAITCHPPGSVMAGRWHQGPELEARALQCGMQVSYSWVKCQPLSGHLGGEEWTHVGARG